MSRCKAQCNGIGLRMSVPRFRKVSFTYIDRTDHDREKLLCRFTILFRALPGFAGDRQAVQRVVSLFTLLTMSFCFSLGGNAMQKFFMLLA